MTALEKACTAWGARLPDWVEALARACDEASQSRAAKRIGYSPATVSYVLTARYTGDLAAVERAVRASVMAESVACPEMGTMALAVCLEWRRRVDHFQAVSSLRARMRRACQACPRHDGSGTSAGGGRS